jgi:hypothetical protein
MSALRMFIPITKVDAAQRLVYGLATAEAEDRAGEICDYASTKPNYEKWSAEIAKSTNGKSLGNVRAMHGAVAAGKVTKINFNDADKQIEICAKVIDDAEWEKVAEGVYTGFSQGGAYARRWTDEDGLTRYTAEPSEISLVDLPCLPQARFEMIKLDGARELRRFRKGSDAAARLQFVIDELNDLQSAGALDADGDGDGSDGPDLRGLIAQAAALLGGLSNEENPDSDRDAEQAAQPLRMSARSHKSVRRGGAALSKIGARNSEVDQGRLQKLHDTAVELGAACGGAQKFAAGDGLEKKFDALAATLADVLQRVKQIEAQPLPLPFGGQARAITKNEDAGFDPRGSEALEKLLLDPEALSILAIKLAQRNGRSPMR